MPWSWYRRFLAPAMVALGLLVSIAVVRAQAGALEPRSSAAAPAEPSASESAIRQAIRGGKYAEAEALARDAIARHRRAGARDSPQLATLLDLLTESLWRGGKAGAPEAEALGLRALRMRRVIQGAHHPDVARSQLHLGTVYLLRGAYDEARTRYESALALREKALGPDHPDVAAVLNNLATLERLTGRLEPARGMYERALAIRLKALGPSHVDVAASYGNMATVLMLQGDLSAARTMFERDLGIAEAALGPRHPHVMQTLANLGIVNSNLADYDAARRAYERALVVAEATGGPEHPETAQVLGNLGVLFEEMGDYPEAAARHRRALAIREKAWGPDHRDVAESLLNLAVVRGQMGALAEARALAERGVKIYEKTLDAGNADLGHAVGILAALEAESGDRTAARRDYERALAILSKALGAEHYKTTRIEGRLGELLLDSGEPGAARLRLEESLSRGTRLLGTDHPGLVEDRCALARAEAALGNREAALRLSLSGEEAARRHIRLTARFLVEREALRYARRLAGNLDVALLLMEGTTASGTVRHVWDAVVRSRALVFDALATRHREAAGSADAVLDSLRARVRATSAQRARLIVRGPGAGEAVDYVRILREATVAGEEAERALTRRVGLDDATRLEEPGLEASLAARPPGSTLVAYRRFVARARAGAADVAYLAFVAPPGDVPPRCVPLGPAARIDSLVTQWRRLARTGEAAHARVGEEAASRAAGEALRRAVWDGLEVNLATSQGVFIVPDGALSLVNFAALPSPEGGFLIESGTWLHQLSTERDLVGRYSRWRNSGHRAVGLLVVGDPDFDGVIAAHPPLFPSLSFRGGVARCPELAQLRFERLPATHGECEEVRRLWQWRRREEGRVKAALPGRRVLHLATHGFFLGGDCTPSAPGGRGVGGVHVEGDGADSLRVPESPLHLAGLALAGANRRREAAPDAEDGILSAEEIASLDLQGVEWSVLSACDSGLGDIQSGEGVFGLRRAFQLAGSATVIMSLWPVEDEGTRAWMKALYTGRLEKQDSTAEAVRRASLAVLAERRRRGLDTRPGSWGAFVATGDWR